jgi:hypothetical protein
MTNDQVVAVGVRVAGIALLIGTLGPALQLIPFSMRIASAQPYWLAAYGLETVAFAVLGLLMVAMPSQFARAILPEGTHPASPWSLEEFQAVLFSVLGVYFLVTTLTNMSDWVRAWNFFSGNARSVHWPDVSDVAAMATIALKLAVGIWLLLGARGLASIIRRLRSY